MELKEEHKRLNSITGKPFEQGFIDQNGRVFYSYVNKIGNDGWYLEEWKKDMAAYDSSPSIVTKGKVSKASISFVIYSFLVFASFSTASGHKSAIP